MKTAIVYRRSPAPAPWKSDSYNGRRTFSIGSIDEHQPPLVWQPSFGGDSEGHGTTTKMIMSNDIVTTVWTFDIDQYARASDNWKVTTTISEKNPIEVQNPSKWLVKEK